jgi:hypothetical protein
MIISIGLAILVFCLLCLGIVAWIVRTAPAGYEDATGFHYGEPEKPLIVEGRKITT